MVGHGGSSAGSYLANPTSPIPSHCASIVATSTLRAKTISLLDINKLAMESTPKNTRNFSFGELITIYHACYINYKSRLTFTFRTASKNTLMHTP